MFLAVGILTWMIFWMRKQSRSLKSSLENEMQTALGGGHNRGIFMVAFLAVFREGVETALFLSAAAFTSDGMSTLLGAVVGLVAAVLVGYLVYASTVRLNMRLFFDVTAVLLLAFAAGLFARGIHEFQEASLLPFLMQQAWNTNLILEDTSTVGLILRAAFGYNGAPSLLEVIGYWLYWIVTLFGVRWWVNRKSAQRAVPAHA
jgi:high-affinity iron transporter